MKTIEYRIKPVTRYIVTKFEAIEDGAHSVGEAGEFPSEALACNAISAFGAAETIQTQPANLVITRIPRDGYEEKRVWTLGEGWDDEPQLKRGDI